MLKRKKKVKHNFISVRSDGVLYLVSDNAFPFSVSNIDIAKLHSNTIIEIGLPEAIVLTQAKREIPTVDPSFARQIDNMFVKRLAPMLRRASRDHLYLGTSERKKQRKVIRMFCDKLSSKTLSIQDRTYNFYKERAIEISKENMDDAKRLEKTASFLEYGAAWSSLFLMYNQTNVLSCIESQNDYEAEKTAGGPYNVVRGDRPYYLRISTQDQVEIRTDGDFRPAICGRFSSAEAVYNAAIISAFLLFSVAKSNSVGLHIIIGGEHVGSIDGETWKIQRGAICCFVQDGPESEWDFSHDY